MEANFCALQDAIGEATGRHANGEVKVTGRFCKGSLKSQLLLNEKSTLAAMTYVDLNPVRADIAAQFRGWQSLMQSPQRPLVAVRQFRSPVL